MPGELETAKTVASLIRDLGFGFGAIFVCIFVLRGGATKLWVWGWQLIECRTECERIRTEYERRLAETKQELVEWKELALEGRKITQDSLELLKKRQERRQ